MKEISVKLPLPPRDCDYFTTARIRTKDAAEWERIVQTVFANMPGCPVTDKCDVDFYIKTRYSTGMMYNTSLYYILEQTPAIATVGNICSVRFHYSYVKAKGRLWMRISNPTLPVFPKENVWQDRLSPETWGP